MTDKRTIQIAGMGDPPAAFTETAWALCHRERAKVPNETVVRVTKSGNEPLQADREAGRHGKFVASPFSLLILLKFLRTRENVGWGWLSVP